MPPAILQHWVMAPAVMAAGPGPVEVVERIEEEERVAYNRSYYPAALVQLGTKRYELE